MFRLAALALLLSLGAAAQGNADRVVVEVKHLSGSRFDQAIKLLNQFLQPGSASGDQELHAVVLRGSPETVTAAEALLKKFDVPVPGRVDAPLKVYSYQLRIYMVEALASETSSPPVPAEIQPAVEQMKRSFVYKGYRLMDTVIMQTESRLPFQPIYNGPSVSGMLATEAVRLPTTYQAQIGELFATDEGKSLQLKRFSIRLRLPVSANDKDYQFVDASIGSDLSLRVGQKLVVGKLPSPTPGNAIFCILTAEPNS